MVERRNPKGGGTFLGCSGFTERDLDGKARCTETMPLPASVVLRRAGAAELPGLDG